MARRAITLRTVTVGRFGQKLSERRIARPGVRRGVDFRRRVGGASTGPTRALASILAPWRGMPGTERVARPGVVLSVATARDRATTRASRYGTPLGRALVATLRGPYA